MKSEPPSDGAELIATAGPTARRRGALQTVRLEDDHRLTRHAHHAEAPVTNPKDDRQRQEGEAKGGEFSPKTGRDHGSESGGRRGPSGWPDMQGEGNRDAAREYNESQRDFVQSGQVDEAARDAEPRSDEERREMERAEREGRSHARK
jgi:hypothetical protein